MKFTFGILILAASLGLAEDIPSPPEQHYREGYRLLKQAEQGKSAPERIAGLQSSAGELRTGVAAQPDHYLARALLAQTLFGLLRESPTPTLVAEAQEQFAAAAKLPEADWRIFNAYGRFLLFTKNFQEAPAIFEKALSLARWNTDRSAINNLYGQCLYQMAIAAPVAEKRQRLADAVQRLTSATKELPAASDAVALRTLGNALVDLGQLDHNSDLFRQALSSLQEAANNPETHYALARAYALLGESDQAILQLRLAIESTNVVALAQAEPAFASLRDRQDFRRVLATGENVRTVDPLLREGLDYSEKADAIDGIPARIEVLKRAVECFRKAAQLDSGIAHSLWAETLARMAEITLSREERAAFAAQARAQFPVAAKRPGVDWRLYYSWGVLLDFLAENGPQSRELFQEATGRFEAGLKLASSADERRLLQRELAASLLGHGTGASLDRCVKICEELARMKSPDQTRVLSIWGRALILTGKSNKDRMKLRLAAEKLASALELDPKNPDLQYRLATVYALLDSKQQALRHLQTSLENDPTRSYHESAAHDSDLDSLRSLPEFYELTR